MSKQQYIQQITQLAERCEGKSLLDLIYQILSKEVSA